MKNNTENKMLLLFEQEMIDSLIEENQKLVDELAIIKNEKSTLRHDYVILKTRSELLKIENDGLRSRVEMINKSKDQVISQYQSLKKEHDLIVRNNKEIEVLRAAIDIIKKENLDLKVKLELK